MNERLPASSESPLTGELLARDRALEFSLNGHKYAAFEGDTLFSALLANGVLSVGRRGEAPLGLNLECSPLVRTLDAPGLAPVPMSQVPVRAGAQYQTLGRADGGFVRRFIAKLGGRRDDLGLDDEKQAIFGPVPLPVDITELPGFDFVVVGGGVAGMSAALAASRQGYRVALIEQQGDLGGDALLFGKRAGEPAPDEQIAGLSAGIAAASRITVFRYARALSADQGAITVQFGAAPPPGCRSGVARLPFGKLVLATGCAERLPIFAGNRLPGVAGLSAAFHLGHAYGIWPGQNCLIAGGTNLIYRLGMLASDAGSAVEKLCDSRLEPSSRFRDFSKAYGLRSNVGTRVHQARLKGGKLRVALGSAFGGLDGAKEEVGVDRLIVSEGWVPRLGLWREAGGQCGFDTARGQLMAGDGPQQIAVVGSAAGFLRTIACVQSGEAALARWSGENAPDVDDTRLDPAFETEDLALGAPPDLPPTPPAYLGWGCGLLRLHAPSVVDEEKGLAVLPGIEGQERALDLEDIDVLTRLGAVAPEFVDALARERHLPPRMLRAGAPLGVETVARERGGSIAVKDQIPAYLRQRFGPDAVLCHLDVEGGGNPGCGALIFSNSDQRHPLEAEGVVLAPETGHMLALLAAAWGRAGKHVVVRGLHGPMPAVVAGPAEQF